MICKRCNKEVNLLAKRVGPHVGLYCCECGAWIKWEPKLATTLEATYRYSIVTPEYTGELIEFIHSED